MFTLKQLVDTVYSLDETEKNPLVVSRMYAQLFPNVTVISNLKLRFEQTESLK